jgi:hypothetical protein
MRAAHGGIAVAGAASWLDSLRFPTSSTASGWYDVTVTVSSDNSWSQRFTGHLENGQPSVTG